MTAATSSPVIIRTGKDAHLLGLCQGFDAMHVLREQCLALGEDDAADMAADTRRKIATRIRDTAPTTVAGHRAKWEVALVLLGELLDGEESHLGTFVQRSMTECVAAFDAGAGAGPCPPRRVA